MKTTHIVCPNCGSKTIKVENNQLQCINCKCEFHLTRIHHLLLFIPLIFLNDYYDSSTITSFVITLIPTIAYFTLWYFSLRSFTYLKLLKSLNLVKYTKDPLE